MFSDFKAGTITQSRTHCARMVRQHLLYLALGVSCSLIDQQQPKEQAEEQLTIGGCYLSWDVDPLGLVWEQGGSTPGQALGSLEDVQPGLTAGMDVAVCGQAARAQEQPKLQWRMSFPSTNTCRQQGKHLQL